MTPDPRDRFTSAPAPVFSGSEPIEARPIPVRPARRRRAPSRARVATFGLGVASGLWLLALAASQATSPTVALPLLERAIGALADVPSLLTVHEQAVRESATRSTDERVGVPGFPVPGVALPRALAQSGSREEWQGALLRQSAEAAYERGPAVFSPNGTPTQSGSFSTSQWVRVVMGILSSTTHSGARTLAWALGLLTLALGVVVMATADGVRRFVAVGLALTGGAALAGVAGLGGLGLIYLLTVGEAGTFVDEVTAMVRTVAWTPLHLALRLGIAGLAIALPAGAVAAWLSRDEEMLVD